MEIARALILAAAPHDDQPWSSLGPGPKPLIPVATKPIVFHALDALSGVGVLEACLLSDHDAVGAFREAVGDGGRWGMRIDYAAGNGSGDVGAGLLAAQSFIDGEAVLVQRADALLSPRLREHFVEFSRAGVDAVVLMLMPARSSRSQRRTAGALLLSPRAVTLLTGRPTVGDPLARLRRHGARVHELEVEGCLACDGGEASLLEANRHALSQVVTAVDGATIEGSELQGPVAIDESAVVSNSLVRGPAVIGPGARIVDAYVGPYTSIGAYARIEGTEIEHSIVMDHARLLFVGSRLETSIIGCGASIVRRFDMPNAARMSVGDGAQVALS